MTVDMLKETTELRCAVCHKVIDSYFKLCAHEYVEHVDKEKGQHFRMFLAEDMHHISMLEDRVKSLEKQLESAIVELRRDLRSVADRLD